MENELNQQQDDMNTGTDDVQNPSEEGDEETTAMPAGDEDDNNDGDVM